MKIVGIVALYNPTDKDLRNISTYINELDYCYLMDDSPKNNRKKCQTFINKYSNKICYIHNEQNLGLCASVNKGFKISVKKNADWILVMNPDGTFNNNAINIYREYIENHDCSQVAIIAPQYNFDRHPRVATQGIKKIKYADMSGSLYNAMILKQLNFYDQNTYFYGLDTEYCLRVISNGFKIVECSQAVLNHHPATTKSLTFFGRPFFKYGQDSPERYYYQFRSGLYIHKKYHNYKQDAFMIYKLLKVIFLFNEKKQYFYAIRKAIKDAKHHYYGKINND